MTGVQTTSAASSLANSAATSLGLPASGVVSRKGYEASITGVHSASSPTTGKAASGNSPAAGVNRAAPSAISGDVYPPRSGGSAAGFRTSGISSVENVSSSSEKSGATAGDGTLKDPGTGKVTFLVSHSYGMTLVTYNTTPTNSSEGAK